jgi:hypothetical protein
MSLCGQKSGAKQGKDKDDKRSMGFVDHDHDHDHPLELRRRKGSGIRGRTFRSCPRLGLESPTFRI